MIKRLTKKIKLGSIEIGGNAPITVQSMTNTITKDVDSTVNQILDMEEAGCDIVRAAINDLEDAKAISKIKEKINIPFIADIQFNSQLAVYALENDCDCLRINPGNIGTKFEVKKIVDLANEKNIPIRVGVNAGSLSQKKIDKYGGVNPDSIVASALEQIKDMEEMDFFNMKVALKSSNVLDTIAACKLFSRYSDYPLHLGITEAGLPFAGSIKSAIGIGSLLLNGIGDTLRVSLTDDPRVEIRAGIEILKACGLRREGLNLISCPTCARTDIDLMRIVNEAEDRLKDIQLNIDVAIMGCPVNGPGEAKEADIGIAGGQGEGVLFAKGKIIKRVKEENMVEALYQEIKKMEDENEKGKR